MLFRIVLRSLFVLKLHMQRPVMIFRHRNKVFRQPLVVAFRILCLHIDVQVVQYHTVVFGIAFTLEIFPGLFPVLYVLFHLFFSFVLFVVHKYLHFSPTKTGPFLKKIKKNHGKLIFFFFSVIMLFLCGRRLRVFAHGLPPYQKTGKNDSTV